jgi:acyl transferase domain-containing protein
VWHLRLFREFGAVVAMLIRAILIREVASAVFAGERAMLIGEMARAVVARERAMLIREVGAMLIREVGARSTARGCGRGRARVLQISAVAAGEWARLPTILVPCTGLARSETLI